MPKSRTPVIAALDVGTTKICALLAEPVLSRNAPKLKLRPLAYAHVSSEGMERARVVSVEALANSIYKAVNMCLGKAPRLTFDNVYVGIAGNHIISKTESFSIDIDPCRGVRESDVGKLLGQATKSLSDKPPRITNPNSAPGSHNESDYQLTSYILNGFWLDQDFIPLTTDLFNLRGRTLSVELHAVYANRLTMDNIRQAIQIAGLRVKEFIPESYASSLAVLDEFARDNGVIVLDIGGGTTDIAVFYKKRLLFTGAVSYGGDMITSDLQRLLNTTHSDAERLKQEFGVISNRHVVGVAPKVQVYDVALRQARPHPQSEIYEIIEARMSEILEDARSLLENSNASDELPHRSIVLTGGGALLNGIDELAERVFEVGAPPTARVQAVVATPTIFTGQENALDSPAFSTVAGLAYHGAVGSPLSSFPIRRWIWFGRLTNWWHRFSRGRDPKNNGAGERT